MLRFFTLSKKNGRIGKKLKILKKCILVYKRRMSSKLEYAWMKLKDCIALGAVCAGVVCMESIREQWNFNVTKYQICTSKINPHMKPKRMIFLSDLHNHEYGQNNIRLLQAVKAVCPDLILIGGDMLVGKRGRSAKAALQFVSQLPKITPVYYANGNHEQRMKENPEKYERVYERYREILQNAGVHFLENDSLELHLEGFHVRLTGLELPMETYEKFKHSHVRKEDIVLQVGEVRKEMLDSAEEEESVYEILLAHNPTYYSAYKEWGADLVLSGHLHGGIARIPGWRGVITPQAFLFPKYSGEMTEEDGQTIIVSKGLGTHTINFRLFNIPEMVVLEFIGNTYMGD